MDKIDVWIAVAIYITGAQFITTDKDLDQLHPTCFSRDRIDPDKFRPQNRNRCRAFTN